jgi:DEAD/DEAH box helicase domain-containing protein
MSDKIVLDLETKKTFDEVGGHHNSHLLEVSVCGVYSYARDEYRGFKEHEFAEMLEWLKAADLIIGFNSKHFDFTVLQPYYPNFNLGQLPHLDILEEITNILGRRLKLESVAQETLGYGKSGDGLDAIRYFHAAIQIVASYNEDQIVTTNPQQLLDQEARKREAEANQS